jgi:hypothetical protein
MSTYVDTALTATYSLDEATQSQLSEPLQDLFTKAFKSDYEARHDLL